MSLLISKAAPKHSLKSDLFFQKPSPHDEAEDDYDDDLEVDEDDESWVKNIKVISVWKLIKNVLLLTYYANFSN